MKATYLTLLALFDIAQNDRRPHSFSITPKELILHITQDWELTVQDLNMLSIEGLVHCEMQNGYTIRLTEKGWGKSQELLSTFGMRKAV